MRALRLPAFAVLVAIAGLLATATPAAATQGDDQQAVPLCYVLTYPKAYTAACLTAMIPVSLAVGTANCLLNTAPVNWASDCLGPYSVTIPLLDYAFCYYTTPPSNWNAVCV
jgi:hypothetical protein